MAGPSGSSTSSSSELDRRGHEVTTFASGDSEVPGRHVATVPEALRPSGYSGDSSPYILADHPARSSTTPTEFDIIHSHLEWASFLLARVSPIPVVSTFHGRLDLPWAAATLRATDRRVSSRSATTRRRPTPRSPWAGVVHNGLTLDDAPFERRRGDALCFVGRVTPEKGIVEAIEIADDGRPPAADRRQGGPDARPSGTTSTTSSCRRSRRPARRSSSSASSSRPTGTSCSPRVYAALMPGSWPEPFGLVAIEALACGTPVIARRVGGLPEIIRDGVDGFFGDDVDAAGVPGRSRRRRWTGPTIRESVIDRFSAGRMTDGYEAVYRAMLARRGVPERGGGGSGGWAGLEGAPVGRGRRGRRGAGRRASSVEAGHVGRVGPG